MFRGYGFDAKILRGKEETGSKVKEIGVQNDW